MNTAQTWMSLKLFFGVKTTCEHRDQRKKKNREGERDEEAGKERGREEGRDISSFQILLSPFILGIRGNRDIINRDLRYIHFYYQGKECSGEGAGLSGQKDKLLESRGGISSCKQFFFPFFFL